MEDFVRKSGRAARYRSYGSQGQNQYGIDLVPADSSLPAVGQCKMVEGSFTWKDVLAEVKKTDEYSGCIECYVLFTTSNRHTTIQDQQNAQTPYRHARPDGSSFPVFVRYWQDYERVDLSFIPVNVLRNAFSNAVDFAESLLAPSADDYAASLGALRRYVPTRITLGDLAWLEEYDFSVGWVAERAYEPFRELQIDIMRLKGAERSRLTGYLHSAGNQELKATLLAGDEFYSALGEFVEAIRPHIIGKTEGDGTSTLTLVGVSEWQKKAHHVLSCARHLAQIYRKAIVGR
jgi:hypothetical protein